MRYAITFSYHGANYHGWQRQPNDTSVQQTLDEALSMLTREKVESVGAGRTDTGVHARMMVAHFDLSAPLADTDNFVYRINKLLPRDIAVSDLSEVADDFSARFSAKSRTYRYYVTTRKDPFLVGQAAYISFDLDIDKMNEAAALLLKTEDFASFSKKSEDQHTSICYVSQAQWVRCGSTLVFTISANRFLRNMVRAVVGTLLDVGRGKITLSEFQSIIDKKDRCSASTSAPAEGLFLEDIQY